MSSLRARRAPLGALALTTILLLVACPAQDQGDSQDGEASPSPEPADEAPPTSEGALPSQIPQGCRAAGSEPVELEAEDVRFDTDCLSVRAGGGFRVELKHRDDGLTHSFSIYETENPGALFTGDLQVGRGERIYEVPALKTGAYRFQCEIHPEQMNGRLFAS